jgi:hypothetical protein
MAEPVSFPGDVHVNGTISCRDFNPPDGCIEDDSIEAGANIAASKVIHQHALHYDQKAGTAVVAETRIIHTFKNAAEIVAVEVVPHTKPTGGDLAFTVDVQLGNASTAFATILSAPVTVNSSSANRTIQTGTISNDTAADGDSLLVVVAVTGSTGTQGQGFGLTVWVREEP